MNAKRKPVTPASAAPKSITLSQDTRGRVTDAGIADGIATKKWKLAADGLIAEGVTPDMLGTVGKPDGMDGKANPDVTRQVVAAINASFSALDQLIIGTDRDAINVNALDLMARFDGNDPATMKSEEYAAAVQKIRDMAVDVRKGRLAGIRARKLELQSEQSSKLGRLRRYLIAGEEAAEKEASGTPRGPKSDLDRVHERIADAVKYLQRQGEKKDGPIFDVAQAVKLLREADKIVPRV